MAQKKKKTPAKPSQKGSPPKKSGTSRKRPSRRIPAVRKLVTEIFDREPNLSQHPDEAVALGATVLGLDPNYRLSASPGQVDMPEGLC